METPRRAPMRSCRRSGEAPPPAPKKQKTARRSLVFGTRPLNKETMLKNAENLQDDLRTYLETLDADVFGFVTFCLSELTETDKSACWFCSSTEKALALSKAMKMLCDARVTLNNTDANLDMFDFFADWTRFYKGIPKITNDY